MKNRPSKIQQGCLNSKQEDGQEEARWNWSIDVNSLSTFLGRYHEDNLKWSVRFGDMAASVMPVKVSSTEMPTTKCITRKGRALAPQMHLDSKWETWISTVNWNSSFPCSFCSFFVHQPHHSNPKQNLLQSVHFCWNFWISLLRPKHIKPIAPTRRHSPLRQSWRAMTGVRMVAAWRWRWSFRVTGKLETRKGFISLWVTCVKEKPSQLVMWTTSRYYSITTPPGYTPISVYPWHV